MLEERAADRHDANVGAMGYRTKENIASNTVPIAISRIIGAEALDTEGCPTPIPRNRAAKWTSSAATCLRFAIGLVSHQLFCHLPRGERWQT